MEEYYSATTREEMQSKIFPDIDYSIIRVKVHNIKIWYIYFYREKVKDREDTEYNRHSIKEVKSSYELKEEVWYQVF